jgi:hypothetical protein
MDADEPGLPAAAEWAAASSLWLEIVAAPPESKARRLFCPLAKRQGAGAVLDASRDSQVAGKRLASWTAVALHRFSHGTVKPCQY